MSLLETLIIFQRQTTSSGYFLLTDPLSKLSLF